MAGLLGGWLFGLRTWASSPATQLLLATAALTAAAGLVALFATPSGSLIAVAGVLGLAGLAVPPILVLTSVLTERHVRQAVLTQGFTWQNSASAAGSAAAAALGGLVVDQFHARGGFALAGSAALSLTLLAIAIASRPNVSTNRGANKPE